MACFEHAGAMQLHHDNIPIVGPVIGLATDIATFAT